MNLSSFGLLSALLGLFVGGLSVEPSVAAPGQAVVLFDEGHGQLFLIGRDEPLDLSRLASVVAGAGAQPRTTSQPLASSRLTGVDAVVISGAFKPFESSEIEALVGYLETGGRLAIMLHIPFPAAPLLHRLGLAFSNGVIREREDVLGNEAINFRVHRLGDHLLTEGLESFDAYGSWALLAEGEHAKPLAVTGPRAWVDLDGDGVQGPGDVAQSFAVAVTGRIGRGEFVVFGDDAIFQNRFLRGGNEDLAANLARWLARGAPPPRIVTGSRRSSALSGPQRPWPEQRPVDRVPRAARAP